MTSSAKQSKCRECKLDYFVAYASRNDGGGRRELRHFGPSPHLKPTPPAGTLPATSAAGWTMTTFEHVIVESKGAVGIITLNRPKMLNALSFGVFREIAARQCIEHLRAEIGRAHV